MTPESTFFEEEERCGYLVSAKMKKIWAVELDLMEQFQRVCREHGLRWFVSGGTLLGAVRHGGFIPWDDDVDIVMMREDYEKWCAIAPTAFAEPVFFQTVDTDKGYARGHAQLRNSNTTAILPNEGKQCPFNQGIFIDIFPLDAVPDDPAARRRQQRKLKLMMRLLDATVRYPANPRKNVAKNVIHAIASVLPYRWIYRRMERIATQYNGQDTARVAPLTFRPDDPRLYYPRADFAAQVEMPFEMLRVDAPAGYDDLLTVQYGDYHEMRQENSYHGTVQFDAERSYRDYLR